MATAAAATTRWQKARVMRAKAAEMEEDIQSLIGWVSDRQDEKGRDDQHVKDGWALVRGLSAHQMKLLAAAHVLEVGQWTRGA